MGEGGGRAKILQKIIAPPLSVIKIVKYCGVGGVVGGALKSYKDMAPPLFDIKIVISIAVSGEGGGNGGRQNPTKNYGAPSLCH